MPNLKYLVLQEDAAEDRVLTPFPYLLLLRLRDYLPTLILLQDFHFLSLESPHKLFGRASLAVVGLQGVDQELQEHVHLGATADNQVDVPMLELKGNTIPTIKWDGVDFIRWQSIDMLPVHPESGGEATDDETHNILDLAASTRPDVGELHLVQVLVKLRRQVVICNLWFVRLSPLPVHVGGPDFLNDHRVLLVYVLQMLLRFPVRDDQFLSIWGKLDVRLIAVEVLDDLLESVVVFETIDFVGLQKVADLIDLINFVLLLD